jgi:hypothetical protein
MSEAPLRCVLVQEICMPEKKHVITVPYILKHESPFVTSKHFANPHIIFVPFGFVT